MYKFYNPNPAHKRVGDCTIRALSKVLGQDWKQTYIELCVYGFINCDMPSANNVWGAYLKSKGYKRHIIPEDYVDGYTVEDFCEDFPNGTYLLALQSHVVGVVDGDYYDTFDSGHETPIYFWKNANERID